MTQDELLIFIEMVDRKMFNRFRDMTIRLNPFHEKTSPVIESATSSVLAITELHDIDIAVARRTTQSGWMNFDEDHTLFEERA